MSTPSTTSRADTPYGRLSRQIRAAGLLDRRPTYYAIRTTAILACYLGAWAAIVWIGSSWYQLLAAFALGLVFTQVAFLGHDCGHQQIFRRRRTNDVVGRLFGNLLCGLSYGWWVNKHNRHHANPNKEGRDPDIGSSVLVFTTNQVALRTGAFGRTIAKYQAWLFFPLLTLEGWNMHTASALSLWPSRTRSDRGGSRLAELGLLVAHAAFYLGILLVIMSPLQVLAFVAVHQAVWGVYMGCSFAPNHKGMPIVSRGEELDYLRRQVLTSRDIRGGVFVDILLGGLNYQIEHHLFPSMPAVSLGSAQLLIRAYCLEQDVPYLETSLIGSYQTVLSYLNELGRPLRAASGPA